MGRMIDAGTELKNKIPHSKDNKTCYCVNVNFIS